MNIKFRNRFIVFFIWAILSSAAAMPVSASLIIEDGYITGATGIAIDGGTYDVSFMDGTCIDLYDGCIAPDDFPFPNGDVALEATLALQAVLTGVYDPASSYLQLAGCDTDLVECRVLTPYFDELLLTTGNVKVWGYDYYHFDADGFLDVSQTNVPTSINTLFIPDLTWAVWGPSADVVGVPEPGSLMLMILALAGLGIARRKDIKG